MVKARTPHGFVNISDGLLKQIDVHVNSTFRQQNLEPTEISKRAGLPDRPFAQKEGAAILGEANHHAIEFYRRCGFVQIGADLFRAGSNSYRVLTFALTIAR